jgi:hypothetical protein
VDDRSRQQRRFDERADLKRKRDEEPENESWETGVCYPWMELMGSNRLRQPVSASRL